MTMPSDRKQSNPSFGGNLLLVGLILIIVFGAFGLSVSETDSYPKDTKFKITFQNFTGTTHGYCHHYERDGESWKFYDAGDNLLGEIAPSAELTVFVKRIDRAAKRGK